MSSSYTPPDYAEWLRTLDTVIQRMQAGLDVSSYSVGGMTFTNRSIKEVMDHRASVYELYNEELGGSVVVVDRSEDYGQ